MIQEITETSIELRIGVEQIEILKHANRPEFSQL